MPDAFLTFLLFSFVLRLVLCLAFLRAFANRQGRVEQTIGPVQAVEGGEGPGEGKEAIYTPGVFVCSAAITKPHSWAAKAEVYLHPVLEAEGLGSRCEQGRFLLRLSPWHVHSRLP